MQFNRLFILLFKKLNHFLCLSCSKLLIFLSILFLLSPQYQKVPLLLSKNFNFYNLGGRSYNGFQEIIAYQSLINYLNNIKNQILWLRLYFLLCLPFDYSPY